MLRRPPRSPLFPTPPLSRSSRSIRHMSRVAPFVFALILAVAPQTAVAEEPAAIHTLLDLSFSECHNPRALAVRSEEHTSELQSQSNLVCRLLLEKKKVSH